MGLQILEETISHMLSKYSIRGILLIQCWKGDGVDSTCKLEKSEIDLLDFLSINTNHWPLSSDVTGLKPRQVRFRGFWAHKLAWIIDK